MSFKTRRTFAAALVISLFIQMHIATDGYASRRTKIAFSSTRDGNPEIYVMDGDGGNQTRLTDDPAYDTDPTWSPDGNRIAFVSTRDGGNDHIYVMDFDGRNLVKLTEELANRDPTWSPDGAKIAFTRKKEGHWQIYVMDADGLNQTEVTKTGILGWNYDPSWSRNGQRIAFVSNRDGVSEIYVMDVHGNNQERLTLDRVNEKRSPTWSPDGQRIAYCALHVQSTFQIYTVDADGSGRIKILTRNRQHKTSPAWSPIDDTIAYSLGVAFDNATINLMTANGKHLKQLSEDHAGTDGDPAWVGAVEWSVTPAANYVTIWGEIKTPTSAR